MKYIKILLSAIVIISALLGLTEVLSYNISSPIMFTALGLFWTTRARESYKESKKIEAILCLALAVITLYVAAYGVYVSYKTKL